MPGVQVMLDGELRMLYKHTPGTTQHAFRARCTFETPLEQLLALAREVDLVPTWNKYCVAADTLGPAAGSTAASSAPGSTAASTTDAGAGAGAGASGGKAGSGAMPAPTTELLVYMVMWMPWPFNNISLTVHACGAELLDENNCIFITYDTPPKLPVSGVVIKEKSPSCAGCAIARIIHISVNS